MGMRLRVLPISHGFAVGIDVADRGLACAASGSPSFASFFAI